jgi:hypothetical protein
MSTDIVQFLWVNGAPSTLERLCLHSFLKKGCTCHLYTYKPVSALPARVLVFPAPDILPKEYVVNAKSSTGLVSRFAATSYLFALSYCLGGVSGGLI